LTNEGASGKGANEYSSSYPLYAEDSYLREFDAVVTRSGPRFVVLDMTAFYPRTPASSGQETRRSPSTRS